MKEEFKEYFPDNSDYEFEVSNFGYVRNVNTGNIVNCNKATGYRYFCYAQFDGTRKVQYIAPLVVKLFKAKPTKYFKQVIYKDGDKSNCRVDNVGWATKSYYLKRSPHIPDLGVVGRKPAYRLFTDAQVRVLRRTRRPIAQVAKSVGVSYQVIKNLRERITYKDVI